MSNVQALYTVFYIMKLYKKMKRDKKVMHIDNAGTLWHINDLEEILTKKEPKYGS